MRYKKYTWGLLAVLFLLLLAGCAVENAGTTGPMPSPRQETGAVDEPGTGGGHKLPAGFVYLDEVIPGVVCDIRYAGANNFTGAPVEGYLAPRAILTGEAAAALGMVQEELAARGLGIKVYDAYRPVQAVNHFLRWAQDPGDNRTKAVYYPQINKGDLVKAGYIARKSGHSRGSTVDVTLVKLDTGEELDMGGPFDFFGPLSHHDTDLITAEQSANRKMLKTVMEKHGFRSYHKEWWHYTLVDEPYRERYFDFPVS